MAGGTQPGSYAPGGYAPGPGGPSGPPPGDPGGRRQSKGPIIAIVIGGVVVLGLVIALVALLMRGGDDDAAVPTATAAAPSSDAATSDQPTSAAPTDAATSDAPTTDGASPTDDAPTQSSGGAAPVGYAETALGTPVPVYDFDDEPAAIINLLSMAPTADCGSPIGSTPEPGMSYYLLDIELSVPAEATDPYTMIAWEFSTYSDSAALDAAGTSLFCQVSNPLPSDVQPGATVTGQMYLVVPDEATWITYAPLLSMSDNDGAAWRVQR